MTPTPWPLPADTTTPPPACHVCGGPLPIEGAIYGLPHFYHADCYSRFHAALWAKENASKTVGQVRQLVGEEVKKGTKG